MRNIQQCFYQEPEERRTSANIDYSVVFRLYISLCKIFRAFPVVQEETVCMHDTMIHVLCTYISPYIPKYKIVYTSAKTHGWFYSFKNIQSQQLIYCVSLCLSLLWVDICMLHGTIYLLSSCDTIFLFYELLLHKEFMVPMISFLHENLFTMMWVSYCSRRGFLSFVLFIYFRQRAPSSTATTTTQKNVHMFSKNLNIYFSIDNFYEFFKFFRQNRMQQYNRAVNAYIIRFHLDGKTFCCSFTVSADI